MTTDKPDERRRAPRVDTSIGATVTAGKRTVPFVIDSLSTTGARLVGPLALGMKEKIAIVFTGGEHRIDVAAEVVRVDTADLLTDQIAVRFLDPSAETTAALTLLVDRMLDDYWSSDANEAAAPDAEITGPSMRVAPEDEDTELVVEPDDD